MSRESSFYIIDILIAIDKIRRYTNKCNSPQDLRYDELVWDATLKELEIIGESINALIKREHLDSTYRKIVDFRNIIVHAYFGIDEEEVWYIVTNKLNQLEKDIKNLILSSSLDLSEAIECAIEENSFSQPTVRYLKTLQKEFDAL